MTLAVPRVRHLPTLAPVLILLPPSEGKTAPRRGKALDLGSLSSPSLTTTRTTLLESLVRLCGDDPDKAAAVLGLGPAQRDLVQRNADLEDALASMRRGGAHVARAVSVMGETTGVLFLEDIIEELVGEVDDATTV